MDDNDPISQFFPDQDSVDLYAVLSLSDNTTPDEIRKAYRRHALISHPDKHACSDPSVKAEAATKFQQIGFAYAVLSDEKRRQRYDRTGRTDEGFELASGEDGWEAYFEELFDRVTRGKLDEMKKEYQGSHEEIEDLKSAYMETDGSIGDIINHIPHSTIEDESRFIVLLSDFIAHGQLPVLPAWESSIHDEKSRRLRKKQGQKEAKEAEDLAKDLGVWDEFYGSGKTGDRKDKGKGKGKGQKGEDEGDHSALQALMLKRKKDRDGFFDNLAAKYAEPKGGKTKRKGKPAQETEESVPKKSRSAVSSPPDLNDEEFEKLQQKLFGEKSKAGNGAATSSNSRKSRKIK